MPPKSFTEALKISRHLVQREPGDEEETDNGKPGLLAEVAQRDERRRIGGDDAGVLKGDQREKEADACGNAELQAHGNGIDQPGAERRERERKEKKSGDEHAAERELPIAAKLGHHGEGEIGVEPHAGRERDRIVGIEPHDEGAECRGKTGGDEHGAMVHPRRARGSRG